MRKFTKLQAHSYILVACIVAIFALLIGCPMPGPSTDPDPAPTPTPMGNVAPALSAPVMVPAFTEGVVIPQADFPNLTFAGTNVDICEITSVSVTGLSLTTNLVGENCVVTGSTSADLRVGNYPVEVTAASSDGIEESATVTISVVAAATLSAPAAPARFSAGTAPFDLSFTGTNVASCRIASAAVNGLSLTANLVGENCVVTVRTTASLLYHAPPVTVTAENSIGTPVSAGLRLNVALAAALSAPRVLNTGLAVTAFTAGDTIPDIVFNSHNTLAASCRITSADVPGLNLNIRMETQGCILSGSIDSTLTAGDYPVEVTATNELNTPVSRTITISVVDAATLSAPVAISLTERTLIFEDEFPTLSFTGTNVAAGSCRITSGRRPSGLIFLQATTEGGNCVVRGRTDLSLRVGTYDLTVTAANSAGVEVSATVTITIVERATLDYPDDPDPVTAGIMSTISPVTFTGANLALTDACSITSALPAGLALSVSQNGQNCVLSGSVETSLGADNYDVTVSATNSVGTPVSRTITVEVVAAATLTVPSDTPEVVEGTTRTLGILLTGSNVEAGSCGITGTLPAGISLRRDVVSRGGDCLLQLIIANTLSEGKYTITVTAANSVGTPTSATVEITVIKDES